MVRETVTVGSFPAFHGLEIKAGELSMIRAVMAGIVSLAVLAVATAQQDSKKAQRKDSQQPDQANRAQKLGEQTDAEQSFKTGQQEAEQDQRTELPESLKKLDLNAQQEEKLLAIYRDSDLKSQQLWDRVQDLHHQAISMEAAVIAAARLEGHDHSAHANQDAHPADSDQDRKVEPAETEKGASASTGNDDRAEKTATDSSPRENAENRRAARNRDENGADARKRNRREERLVNESDNSDKDKTAGWQGLEGDLNIVAIRVGVEQPDGRVREYLLTQPNQNEDFGPDQTFQTHQHQLAQVWKEIHEGHEQLVELEASTIVKVEAELTKAQLETLDTMQSQASNNPQSQNDDSRR